MEVARFDGAKATHLHSFAPLYKGDNAAVFSRCSKHALTQARDRVSREAMLLGTGVAPVFLVGPLIPQSEVGLHLQHEYPWELVRNVEFLATPPTC